jgi:FkbM family methyltransferase
MSDAERDEVRQTFHMTSMEWSLRNLRVLGFQPKCIVDVGAYVGNWTCLVKKVFPDAKVMMLEAQQSKEVELNRVCAMYGGDVSYRLCLLGAEPRERVEFYELETGSSVLAEQSSVPRRLTSYSMCRLDDVLTSTPYANVDFLKLDVQGYELEVLKGATAVLEQTQAILMEVSLLPLIEGAPLVEDVLSFMTTRGFCLYDICSLIRRPLDRALWQSDFLFLRKGSPLLANVSVDGYQKG